MKFDRLLFLNRSSLSPSAEWDFSTTGWRFVRISDGSGYLLTDSKARELREGEVLVVPPAARGSLRASRLAALNFHYFDFAPQLLSSFLTLAERHYFEMLERRGTGTVRVLPVSDK